MLRGKATLPRKKSKISYEQNVKKFQFYINMPNFRLLGSIIKKST